MQSELLLSRAQVTPGNNQAGKHFLPGQKHLELPVGLGQLWLSWSRVFGFISCCRVCLEKQSGKFPHLRSVFYLNPCLSTCAVDFNAGMFTQGLGLVFRGAAVIREVSDCCSHTRN